MNRVTEGFLFSSIWTIFLILVCISTAPVLASDSWVRVDSMTTNAGWYTVGVDTTQVTIHMSNPIAAHPFEFPAQILIRYNLVGYEWISNPQDVVIPGGGQATATFAWADSLATPNLQYDITARLLVPGAQKTNVVNNGDFEGGPAARLPGILPPSTWSGSTPIGGMCR